MTKFLEKATNRFNKVMQLCISSNLQENEIFLSSEITYENLIEKTKYCLSYYKNKSINIDKKERTRKINMLKRLVSTLNSLKDRENASKFYDRLERTINLVFFEEKCNLVSDKEGNFKYYIRAYDWVFAPWDEKYQNFHWWQTITPELIEELFDENDKLRDCFVVGYYDLYKEWAKRELKELGKKIQKEELEGKHPLSEDTLRRILG